MENKQYKDNMNKAEQILKRSVDFIIATCCLILFFPLALACAIAIHLEDGLPVITIKSASVFMASHSLSTNFVL